MPLLAILGSLCPNSNRRHILLVVILDSIFPNGIHPCNTMSVDSTWQSLPYAICLGYLVPLLVVLCNLCSKWYLPRNFMPLPTTSNSLCLNGIHLGNSMPTLVVFSILCLNATRPSNPKPSLAVLNSFCLNGPMTPRNYILVDPRIYSNNRQIINWVLSISQCTRLLQYTIIGKRYESVHI